MTDEEKNNTTEDELIIASDSEIAKLKLPCSMVPGKPGEIECTRSCTRPCEEAERWLAKRQKARRLDKADRKEKQP